MSGQLEDFLKQHTAWELVDGKQSVIDAHSDETIESVLNRLNKNNLISLPVYRNGTSPREYLGFVNMIDIMTYIAFRSYDPANPADTAQFVRETNLKEPVTSVLGLTEESSRMWEFEGKQDLVSVMDHLSKGVHRALVRGDNDEVRILSQSDAVKFITANLASLGQIPMISLSASGLVRGGAAVVSIGIGSTALDGFRKMTMHGVSSVCVLGEDGVSMLGTLSASDLRGVNTATLRSVLQPVLHYLQKKKLGDIDVRSPTAALSKSATLAQAIGTILATKTHRVWVCEKTKPVGVVSLTDICAKFSAYDFLKDDK